ncbi:uncharacterized protein LOC111624139 [Centruroides sculpturatus]|uniref:uncharacterized protein LOC111624139 n=1 Tax=Centruroides sculpturatus TaxID=218467 RepID=UPI000C6D3F42|nr:uncharacterized protein LOC111624139 [Centruroides sculpturatus]
MPTFDTSLIAPRATLTPLNEELEGRRKDLGQSSTDIPENTLLKDANRLLGIVLELCPEHTNTNIKQKERIKIRESVAKLFGYLHEMHAIVKEVRKNTKPQQNEIQPTYSEVTKRNIRPSETTRKIKRSLDQKINIEGTGGSHAVLLYPKEQEDGKLINMNEVTEELKNKIEPQKLKTKITTVKEIRDKGLCIRVGNRNQSKILERAINEIPDMNSKIICKKSEGRRPRVILLNVPQAIPEEKILTYVHSQNNIWNEIELEKFKEECRISTIITRGNQKPNCRHVVLSVTSQIINIFIREKHISMDWATIKVDDSVPILRCYRCCGTGHKARTCTNKQHCSHCGKDHKFLKCDRLREPPCCINCHNENKQQTNDKKNPTNNSALHPNCPIAKRIET